MRSVKLLILAIVATLTAFGACSNTSLGNGMTCVQSATGIGVANPLTLSFGSTPTAGNCIFVYSFTNSGGTTTFSDNQGNTYTSDLTLLDSSLTGALGHGVATTSSGTFTVSATTPAIFVNFGQIIIAEVSGGACTADKSAQANGNADGAHTSGNTAATTSAVELVVGGIQQASCGSVCITAGSGFTLLDSLNSTRSQGIEMKTVSATGVQACTFTGAVGFASAWESDCVTYKSAGGATPATRSRGITF